MKLPAFRLLMVNQIFISNDSSFCFRSPGVQLVMVNKRFVEKELKALSACKGQ